MPATFENNCNPDPPVDPAVSAIIASLVEMPAQERNAFLKFYERWRSLTKDRRAAFAKSVWPDLRDKDIAEVVGVRRRSLYRMDGFMAVKPRLADFKGSRPRDDGSRRRRGFSDPTDPFV